jgi:hypothetical protein
MPEPASIPVALLTKGRLFALAGLASLCGCVEPPAGPAVLALPSADKPFAQFQQEDLGCRAASSQAIGVPPPAPGTVLPPPVPVAVAAQMQETYDVTYTQCMYNKGNKVTTPPPAPAVYAGYPYYGYGPYAPYYYGGYYGGYGPYVGVGVGFRGYWGGRFGGYWGGGYRRW